MKKSSVHRFREIVKVLAFYGFGYILDSKINKEKKSPENLRKAFEELGPTFIKIGQILSTRPDIIPEAYIEELSKLQDDVPPESFQSVNEVFVKEFNKPIDEVFLKFERTPLASASIAQVHKATLKDNKEVIVKIQRPDIWENIHLDISILLRIAHFTKARFIDALMDPEEVLNELLLSTEQELDFKNEAQNIDKFNEYNKDVAFLYSPYVLHNLSSSKVLTMELIEGFKIDNITKLKKEGYDLDDLGKKLILAYFKQIFEDGFFHGDPHPGNILIQGNKICFIDFGIMGNLSKSLKSALNDVILGVAYGDINKIISVLMSIGIKRGFVDRNKLYEDIDYLFASYLSTSLANIQISVLLNELFDCAKSNNIRLPKDFTLLIRGLVIIEGVVSKISPDIKILDIAIPYVKSSNRFSIIEDLSFDEFLLQSYRFYKDFTSLPTKTIELVNSILSGRAKMQLEHKNLDSPVGELNKMINRLVFALVISSTIVGSCLILNSNIGPKIYDISIIGITGFFIAGCMGLWLLVSIIKSGKL